MKTVFSNDMVAHVWANQSQSEGRTANGNFYFEGRRLYSYGRHYVAGLILPNGSTLINGKSYSVTTSGHCSDARRAVRGRSHVVPDLTAVAELLADAESDYGQPGRGDRALQQFDDMATGPRPDWKLARALKDAKALQSAAQTAKARAKELSTPWASVETVALIRAHIRAARTSDNVPTESLMEKELKAAERAAVNRQMWAAEYAELSKLLESNSLAEYARAACKESLADYQARLRVMPRQSGFYTSSAMRDVELTLKRIRKCRAECNRRGWTRMVETLKARAVILQEESAQWEAREDAAKAYVSARRAVAKIRKGDSVLAWLEAGGLREAAAHGPEVANDESRKAQESLREAGAACHDMAGRFGQRMARAARIAGLTSEALTARAERYAAPVAALRKAEARAMWRGRVAALRAFLRPQAGADALKVAEAAARACRDLMSGIRAKAPGPFGKAGWTRESVLELDCRIADALAEARGIAARAAVAAWRQGEGPARLSVDHGGPLLRVKGDTLQTSHGAEVPLAHAVKAFRFIRLCKEAGRDWNANGKTLPVGLFRIDRIESSGNFKAGCHYVKWAEVENAALAAGAFNLAPADTTESKEGVHA